ncbi:MAG: patatin-like phospholipase family protein [Desulfuromonadaceae bacterium]|nr:patatin-like phospholipase family protein [Desulfuromonadaceae bacterium]
MAKRFKIGLALGGGAARAFSHIGVLAGLEKYGITVDIVTGTSMGAMIGAMFATHLDVTAVRERFNAYLASDEFTDSGFNFFKELDSHDTGVLAEVGRFARRGVMNTLMITQTALVNEKTAAESYAYLLDDLDVKQTRIPFAAVALDLKSGESMTLDHGRLREVIAASCAMPGVLRPVELDGRLLVDGGWSETVPITAARRLGADFVIAVDVGDALIGFGEPRNALDIIARADALARRALNIEQLKAADVVLSPHNGVAHWADFSTSGQAVERGEEEVDRRIGEVQLAIKKAQATHWLDWIKWLRDK